MLLIQQAARCGLPLEECPGSQDSQPQWVYTLLR